MSRFETQTCTRCGGSGQYSFNLLDGTKCYGCSGTGNKLTKRGLAAQNFLENLLVVDIENLKVGDAIKIFSFDKKFAPILVIEKGPQKQLAEKYFMGYSQGEHENDVVFYVQTAKRSATINPGTKVRVFHTPEEKEIKINQALKFQETLTKSGTPKKR